MADETKPEAPETPVFDETLEQADLPVEDKQEIASTAGANYAINFTAGPAGPPSPLLDTEEGNSNWDAENFVPTPLEKMPTEGPGSPGYDVYAPENTPPVVPNYDGPELDDHDEDDVKALLERDTADGAGETNPDELPESDVDPNEELAEDYPDLQPSGDAEPDNKENA